MLSEDNVELIWSDVFSNSVGANFGHNLSMQFVETIYFQVPSHLLVLWPGRKNAGGCIRLDEIVLQGQLLPASWARAK